MFAALARQLDLGRFFGRTPAETGPITLDRRRIFILPTRAGAMFAVVLLPMLLGAINYGNSLTFALTFLLGSLAFVSMVHTFRNLRGLRFRAGLPREAFAGDTVLFPLQVENPSGAARYAVSVAVKGGAAQTVDLEADGSQRLELPVTAERRGPLPLPRCTVYSRFPLGLFHAWGYLNTDVTGLVYPKPVPRTALPRLSHAGDGRWGDRGRGNDDFAALRGYRAGDSLRHVYWKAVARGQEMVTKQFGGERSERLWLEWEAAPGADVETRLSHLCRWVLDADGAGLVYGLALPGRRVEPGRGDSHRRECLEALARFEGVR